MAENENLIELLNELLKNTNYPKLSPNKQYPEGKTKRNKVEIFDNYLAHWGEIYRLSIEEELILGCFIMFNGSVSKVASHLGISGEEVDNHLIIVQLKIYETCLEDMLNS